MSQQVTLAAWIEQDEPSIDYEIDHFPLDKGWNGWIISIQIDWNFDDLVYLAVDDQGHLEDYL